MKNTTATKKVNNKKIAAIKERNVEIEKQEKAEAEAKKYEDCSPFFMFLRKKGMGM